MSFNSLQYPHLNSLIEVFSIFIDFNSLQNDNWTQFRFNPFIFSSSSTFTFTRVIEFKNENDLKFNVSFSLSIVLFNSNSVILFNLLSSRNLSSS